MVVLLKKLWKLLVIVYFLSSCGGTSDNGLTIFTATGAYKPVKELCDSLKSDYTIQINVASSGILARQIAQGAKCDVFLSANKQWIDYLKEQKLLDTSSVTNIANNKLVIVTNINNELEVNFDKENIALFNGNAVIGDPAYVPVGKYADQVLKNKGWYDKIKPNLILAKDVASVLKYVELGEADWGIVYYTEAVKSEKVKVVAVIPSELHAPVQFYVSLINDADEKARDLYDELTSSKAGRFFMKSGFDVNTQLQ